MRKQGETISTLGETSETISIFWKSVIFDKVRQVRQSFSGLSHPLSHPQTQAQRVYRIW